MRPRLMLESHLRKVANPTRQRSTGFRPLFIRTAPRVRQLIVMMFMAICGLLSAQSAMASVDRVQHGLDVPHAASAVAGAVVVDDHETSVSGEHEHEQDADEDADGDHAPSHQHAGENAQLFNPNAPSVFSVFGRAPSTLLTLGTTFHGGVNGSSLERPPRG